MHSSASAKYLYMQLLTHKLLSIIVLVLEALFSSFMTAVLVTPFT